MIFAPRSEMIESMSQEQAKQKIGELIKKYEEVLKSGEVKKYTEEETKKDFILPLFEILGWDVFNKKEVSAEEHIKSSGRVDYGFYINGRTKFYLEAKSLKADLNDEDFAKQAIRYSWNRGVTWAILTNFESVKVFNAQAISKYLGDKLYFEIPYSEFLERFDQLWQLSRGEFEHDLIDKEAEKVGKKLQKVSITSLLYKDLNEGREILTKGFTLWNKHLDKDLLDEGVQRLLDRLIFIRVAEDRGIEPPTLQPLLREWKAGPRKEPFFKSLISKFRELDATYNSNLFSPHPFEDWEEYDNVTEEAINTFYGKPGYYEYDFKAIPADVLGTVYENYLGYRLSQSKKELTIAKDAKKRKEQGIYYTPNFIVDYIVRNALGPILDKCRSIEDLKKIKVLDPACGSGSFLIKALEIIGDKYKEFNRPVGTNAKIQIIIENLYGVDLDEQAVEIARLNLMIGALDNRVLFPSLSNNIKNGNSLISGTDEELKKYFGKDYRDKKPFNWQEEFPEVFKQGGFDVVIGNPPYGVELSQNDQKFLADNYKIGSTDTAILFIKRALELLKDKGQFSFIVPKAFCFASNYQKIRKLVWDGIYILADCGRAWKEVKLEQVIFAVQKDRIYGNYKNDLADNGLFKNIGSINKLISQKFGFLLNGVSEMEIRIAEKILANSIMLNEIVTNQRGAMLQKEVGKDGDLDVIGGAQITRAGIKGIKGKINEAKINDEKAYISNSNNSILVQNIIAHIENPTDHIKITATTPDNIDVRKSIIVDTVNQLILNESYGAYFICGILNSNLVNWYAYRFIFGKAIRTMHFDNFVSARIPIIKMERKKYQSGIGELYRKFLEYNRYFIHGIKNSDAWKKKEDDIDKTIKKIDQELYRLYGLTENEVKVIEESKQG